MARNVSNIILAALAAVVIIAGGEIILSPFIDGPTATSLTYDAFMRTW